MILGRYGSQANILAHNRDLADAEVYFTELREVRPDALLISDPGMFMLAKRILPDTELHISTQANNVNYETCLFWYHLGAKRIVLGRELSLLEIREIRERVPEDLALECFVHGAMCISYSGRCLLSNFLTGRDANQGACTHPCRWKYSLVEETRPGEYFPVDETDRGTFIFNSKDLCMVEHIPELVDAGIDSLKIEGRMKTALYVAATARTYRRAIDDYCESPEKYRENLDWYRAEIAKCTFREYTTGFYFGKPGPDAQIYDSQVYERNYKYLGTVESVAADGSFVFEQKNKFCVGDEIEVMKPDGRDIRAKVVCIRDEEGNPVGLYWFNSWYPDAQRWALIENADGSYSIRTAYSSHRALSVNGIGEEAVICEEGGENSGDCEWFITRNEWNEWNE